MAAIARGTSAKTVVTVKKISWKYSDTQHWKLTVYSNNKEMKSNYGAHNNKGTIITYNGLKYYTCSICGRRMSKVNYTSVSVISSQNAAKTTTASRSSGGSSGGGGGGGGGGGDYGGGSSGGNSMLGFRDSDAAAVAAGMGSTVVAGTDAFVSPPQIFYIYNKSRGETYKFDGVIKASHMMALSLTDEIPEGQESKYVNGAKNERNKVTFDVIMSEVYTDRNDLTKRRQSRSESALVVMNTLKRERVLVDVVTNLMTYNNMLLSGIALTQDDQTTHYGFFGQLTFEEKPDPVLGGGGGATATSQGSGGAKKSASSGATRTPSLLVSLFGSNFI